MPPEKRNAWRSYISCLVLSTHPNMIVTILYIYNIILWMDHQETTYANPTLRKLELPQKEVLVGVNVHHRLGDVGNSYWFAVTGCIEPGGI